MSTDDRDTEGDDATPKLQLALSEHQFYEVEANEKVIYDFFFGMRFRPRTKGKATVDAYFNAFREAAELPLYLRLRIVLSSPFDSDARATKVLEGYRRALVRALLLNELPHFGRVSSVADTTSLSASALDRAELLEREAIAVLDRWSARLPMRIANEDIGDACEEIARRVKRGGSRAEITRRAYFAVFRAVVHALRDALKAFARRHTRKHL